MEHEKPPLTTTLDLGVREVQCEDEAAEFKGIFRMDIASFESLLELIAYTA